MTTAQWIIDARNAKKSKKKAEARQEMLQTLDRKRLRALKRSEKNQPRRRKHGRNRV